MNLIYEQNGKSVCRALETKDKQQHLVETRHVTCQVLEIYRWKPDFSPKKNEFDIRYLTGVCSFLAISMYKEAEAYQNTPQTIRKCWKNDEIQETQSIEIAKNSLNFEHAEGGLNLYASASFQHIW